VVRPLAEREFGCAKINTGETLDSWTSPNGQKGSQQNNQKQNTHTHTQPPESPPETPKRMTNTETEAGLLIVFFGKTHTLPVKLKKTKTYRH
jgi:hypothetical protein